MKNYIIILLGVFALFSCTEDKLDTFGSGNFLNFVQNSKIDSLDISFFVNPDKDEIVIPLELAITGKLLQEDKVFEMVIDTSSTAKEENFVLPEKFVFKANKATDTLYLTIKKTARLKTVKDKLFLRIVDNNNFKTGFKNNCLRKIYFTDMVVKPKWWNAHIEGVYLGEFSAKKFNLFFKLYGIADLSDMEEGEIRKYALEFKRYLKENPTYEKDGVTLMKVTVVG